MFIPSLAVGTVGSTIGKSAAVRLGVGVKVLVPLVPAGFCVPAWGGELGSSDDIAGNSAAWPTISANTVA